MDYIIYYKNIINGSSKLVLEIPEILTIEIIGERGAERGS